MWLHSRQQTISRWCCLGLALKNVALKDVLCCDNRVTVDSIHFAHRLKGSCVCMCPSHKDSVLNQAKACVCLHSRFTVCAWPSLVQHPLTLDGPVKAYRRRLFLF